jgi:hypothetical protein
MAAQVLRLRDVATMPKVTLQVLPPIAHNANASEFIIADDAAAYAEHRDTTNREGGTLAFSARAWAEFTASFC